MGAEDLLEHLATLLATEGREAVERVLREFVHRQGVQAQALRQLPAAEGVH